MTFVREQAISATRKRHLCEACDKWIEPGEPAINWAGVTDGDFSTAYYHPECRQAEIALNRANDLYNDEWTRLCDLVEREDRPWLKREHPLAYQRLYMTRDQWAARVGEPA